ncbi:hypothetical protein F511_18118 [Dorcoceras hygrometricum]|uniref:Uncharacterized protein n=1 Tax=Dorcoceras hygrometricum TaxID=472368 RepID=A0A2Z7B923_9LAMI|nr:hypothetical protein F511_18118 [Dorcoceras hygrometricum]
MPMADHDSNSTFYSSGLVSTQEFNPCFNYSSDWVENRYANSQGVVQDRDNVSSSSKIILPFEGLKANEELDQLGRDEGEGNEFIWNGMLAGSRVPW